MGIFDYVKILLRINRLYDRDRAARLKAGALTNEDAATSQKDLGDAPAMSPRLLSYVLRGTEIADERAIDTPERVARAVSRLREYPSIVQPTEAEDEKLRGLLLDIRGVKDDSPKLLQLLREQATPELIRLLRTGRLTPKYTDDCASNLMFILQTLAGFQTVTAIREIADTARFSLCADNNLWTTVQEALLEDPTVCRFYFDELRGAALSGMIRDNLLYVSVYSQLSGNSLRSPFDSPVGHKQLERWLIADDPDEVSMARLSAYDLATLEDSERMRLLELAARHPDTQVRMNAAWSRVKFGDRSGLEVLQAFCNDADEETCDEARARLKALDNGEAV